VDSAFRRDWMRARDMWRGAATVLLGADGRYLDADEQALDLLGVESVEALRATPPETFAAVPPDPAEQEALRRAYYASRAEGVLAEGAFRRTNGELVRVRTAILEEDEGRYRALFYVLERPTTDVTAKTYRISDVLSEWRSAERRLADVDPLSDDGRRLHNEVAALRDQYQQMFRRKQPD
jgi:PAS domain-containing protein